MKLLLTGSSGPKVTARVAAILAQTHEVVGVDITPSPTTCVVADITRIDEWQPYLKGVDAIVHFAALHAPHRKTHSAEDFRRTNVLATKHLLDAACAAGVGRFLLASTTSVYGKAMRNEASAVWVTEALQPEPEDIYDETKLAAEQHCREAFSPSFVTAALRFSRSFPEPAPLMAMYRLHRGVDARDVAQAFGSALHANLAQFEAFNISGETPFLLEDCQQLRAEPAAVLNLRVADLVQEFSRRNWPVPASIDRVYVIEKAKALLGYKPRFGYREFLEELDAANPGQR